MALECGTTVSWNVMPNARTDSSSSAGRLPLLLLLPLLLSALLSFFLFVSSSVLSAGVSSALSTPRSLSLARARCQADGARASFSAREVYGQLGMKKKRGRETSLCLN